MRSILVVALFFVCFYSNAQHEGLGLRLGEPTGISYKKYFSNSANTLELGVGWVQRGWNNRYYRNSFEDYNRYTGFDYQAHTLQSNFYAQARFLRHYPWQVEGMEGNFEWYWGVGALLKIASVNYLYRTTTSLTESDEITDIDLGPEIPFGIEYTFEHVPITLVAEVSVFIEIANRPGIAGLNGALGMRYNFYRRK